MSGVMTIPGCGERNFHLSLQSTVTPPAGLHQFQHIHKTSKHRKLLYLVDMLSSYHIKLKKVTLTPTTAQNKPIHSRIPAVTTPGR